MFGLERTLQMALKISFLQWDSEGLYCNGAMYQDLLEKNLLPSSRTMRMHHVRTLQPDINPKQTVSWFQGRKIKVLEVPCSHSPDWRSRYTSSPPKIYVKSHPNTERDGFVVKRNQRWLMVRNIFGRLLKWLMRSSFFGGQCLFITGFLAFIWFMTI